MGVKDIADYDCGDPCRNLWAAVIRNSFQDLERGGKKTGRPRQSAINFFRSRNSSLPDICALLDINIEKVREQAEVAIGRR